MTSKDPIYKQVKALAGHITEDMLPTGLTEADLERMAKPDYFMPRYGVVVDQVEGRLSEFNVERVAPDLQKTIMAHATNPLRDAKGRKLWLAVLASRQTGKSYMAEMCAYVRAAYIPGTEHLLVADVKDRADRLFKYVTDQHRYMDASMRMPSRSNETRQLSFAHGSTFQVASSKAGSLGIGRAPDSLVISEVPFHENAASMWSKMRPGVRNRSEAMVILESTPASMDEPSAEFYKNMCIKAASAGGRFVFKFSAMFESRLNEDVWESHMVPTNDELRLLEKFGPEAACWGGRWRGMPESNPGHTGYLTLENLAFRRELVGPNSDDEMVVANPQMLNVWYPVDPISCWASVGRGAIDPELLERLVNNPDLVPMENVGPEQYHEFYQPEENAIYVLAADDATEGGADPRAFVVLGVWEDEIEVVARYEGTRLTDTEFDRLVITTATRYNDAVVIVERGGVGNRQASVMRMAGERDGVMLPDGQGGHRRYFVKRLYYDGVDEKAKVGLHPTKSLLDEAFANLLSSLRSERLQCVDGLLVAQLTDYRRDKRVRESLDWRILNPREKSGKGRKRKHHYDLVSALLLGIKVIYEGGLPIRYRASRGKLFGNYERAIAKQDKLETAMLMRVIAEQEEAERRKKEPKKAPYFQPLPPLPPLPPL